MTKVKIEPGICGFTTSVTATVDPDEDTELTVKVATRSMIMRKSISPSTSPVL